MALDKKQDGDSLFSFETNTIMKALRAIFLNLTKLNNIAWSYVSSAAVSDNVSVPNAARFAVIAIIGNHSIGPVANIKGDIFIARDGKTTSTLEGTVAGENSGYLHIRSTVIASWSNGVITITGTSNNGTVTPSGTVYFY